MFVATLYKFTTLNTLKALQKSLKNLTYSNNIKGTLLLAKEGINGTIAGNRQAIDALKSFLEHDGRFSGMEYKESLSSNCPFNRMNIKIKKEIVSFGMSLSEADIAITSFVEPKDWNDLIDRPEVTVLDVRNDYEVAMGSFDKTLDPKIKTFRELQDFIKERLDPKTHKVIAMSCTGGIRCEKASVYMKSLGFSEVYQLKGGILKYLEEVPQKDSLWQGECFVFDHRVSVDHDLKQGSYELCFGCRMPLSSQDKLSKDFEEGVSCSYCINTRHTGQKQRARDRQKQMS